MITNDSIGSDALKSQSPAEGSYSDQTLMVEQEEGI